MEDQVVLVTGGTGYVGSNLIRLLQTEGYRVRTTVRDVTNQKKVKHIHQLCPQSRHRVEIVQADLLDEESWHKAVEGCTYVHHVASPVPLTNPKDHDAVITPAVNGTLIVLKACAKARTVKRVILTGSYLSVFNENRPQDTTYTEQDWADTSKTKYGAYLRSKGLAEKAAWKFVEELPDAEKFELAVVNPALILGPTLSCNTSTSIEMIGKLLRNEMSAIPNLCFPVVDVRDVALGHYRCMVVPEAGGQRHILQADHIWFTEMADVLDKEFKPQGYTIPTRRMNWLLQWFLGMFNPFIGSAFVKRPYNIDTSRMKQVLGITTPIPPSQTTIDMAYTLIEMGLVHKTPGYKGGSPTTITTASAASTE